MASFLQNVQNHIKMWGIRESDFGRLATKNGSFVLDMQRGKLSPTLRTVDKVEAWMRADGQARLLKELEWLQKVTGMDDAAVGTLSVRNPDMMTKLRAGQMPSAKNTATIRAFVRRELKKAGQPDGLDQPAAGASALPPV